MKNRKGFTLVEIVIVIAILGILAALVIPAFQENREEQRYSIVVEYLQSNHCVEMDYSMRDEKIYLVSEEKGEEKRLGIHLGLDNEYFLELKNVLEEGEELMGSWTFELTTPGALESFQSWHGTRKTEN